MINSIFLFLFGACICSAAISCLPSGTIVSPDYGYAKDCKGYVDFFVDGKLNIGIELTRDGKLLASHGKRFNAGGIYASLGLTSWTVVDFRVDDVPDSSVIFQHENCVYVNFHRSANICRATIYQRGVKDETISLFSGAVRGSIGEVKLRLADEVTARAGTKRRASRLLQQQPEK